MLDWFNERESLGKKGELTKGLMVNWRKRVTSILSFRETSSIRSSYHFERGVAGRRRGSWALGFGVPSRG